MMTAKQIHDKAAEIVNGDRQADYGHPRDNHGCTADLWSAYINRRLGIEIILDPRDVCMMNVLQKISRDANKRKDDTLVDIVGYALNAAMVNETTRDVDTGVDNEPPAAVDTPANSEAVEREDGPVVRCFERIGMCKGHPNDSAKYVMENDGRETWVCYRGAEIDAGEMINTLVGNPDWREFPPAEWDAKVAAVKAAAQPHNPPVVPTDQPHNAEVVPSEWPKWTHNPDSELVCVWSDQCHRAHMWTNGGGFFQTQSSESFDEINSLFNPIIITRAEAVRLIGEAAVVEGERLVGVSG